MKKVLFRQPIHLNLSNKGKLRKLEKHVQQKISLPQNLLLTPHEIIDPTPTQGKAKHNYHFYMKHHLPLFHNNSAQQKTNRKSQSGAFRAIHTAYIEDSPKGFPLRSITAVRPFRRGIRANSKINNNTIEIAELGNYRQTNQFIGTSRWRDAIDSFEGCAKQEMPEMGPQIQNQEFEQFYKYKQPVQVPPPAYKNSQVLSGVRILPFKKYNIRELKSLSLKNGNIQQRIDEGDKFEICRF